MPTHVRVFCSARATEMLVVLSVYPRVETKASEPVDAEKGSSLPPQQISLCGKKSAQASVSTSEGTPFFARRFWLRLFDATTLW